MTNLHSDYVKVPNDKLNVHRDHVIALKEEIKLSDTPIAAPQATTHDAPAPATPPRPTLITI